MRPSSPDEVPEFHADPDAWAKHWRTYVEEYVRSLHGGQLDENDVQDITQDVMERLLSRRVKLSEVNDMAPYIRAVARNLYTDFWRRSRTRATSFPPEILDTVMASESTSNYLWSEPPPVESSPEAEALIGAFSTALLECLSILNSRSRILLELHYLEGIPQNKVHEHLPEDFPTWGSKQTLSHWIGIARDSVRRCLAAKGFDEAFS